jgi:trafficking protein particle complex subunit 8
MAQFKKSITDFIQDSFSPTVALHCSHDAEIICAKNNLTFDELLQPFSRLNLDGKSIFIFQFNNQLFFI